MSIEKNIAISTRLTNEGADETPFPKKVFAKAFRLVFKKVEDQTITWLEVKSLDGLRNVANKLAEGELVPVDAFSTLDRQLWGHLAEYAGFVKYDGPADEFSGGIQPAGAAFSDLAEDFSALFGGNDNVLTALASVRDQIMRDVEENLPIGIEEVSHEFVRPDKVNLTPKGEEVLADLVDEEALPGILGPGLILEPEDSSE